MLPILGGVISLLGNIFGGIFSAKSAQATATAQSISAVIDGLKSVNATDAEIAAAVSAAVSADSTSESWLTRSWRPLVSILLWGMVFAMFCGYHPHTFDNNVTPTMQFILDTARGCLFGYMPLRSVDKWVDVISRNKLISKIIEQALAKYGK